MTRHIVALHGLPRAGKDTVADNLVAAGYSKVSFGGAIYDEVSNAFNVPIEKLESDLWKRTAVPQLALENCKDKEFVKLMQELETPERIGSVRRLDGCILDKNRSSRFVLQRWATEYRRRANPHYWVEIAKRQMLARIDRADIVISDLREVPEAMFLEEFCQEHKAAYMAIEITRGGTLRTEHSSDNGLSREHIDKTVTNDEDIPGLLAKVDFHLQTGAWRYRCPRHKCKHPRQENNVIGAMTNTGWRCIDCGTITSTKELEKNNESSTLHRQD